MQIQHLKELELITELKAGNQIAFKVLIKEQQGRVYNTALGILQNQQDAEDISQEVFLSVFQNINRFKGASKLSTWIYSITVAKSLEFIRSKKRKKRFALIQNLFGADNLEPIKDIPNFYHPGIQLENKERAAILFAAIDKLPENQKTAFILHKTEDLSYAEIAVVMDVTISSVESLMFRAKQNLQKLLEDYYEKNEK